MSGTVHVFQWKTIAIDAANNAAPESDDTRTANDSISIVNDIYSDSEDDCDKKTLLRKWYSDEDVSYFSNCNQLFFNHELSYF